MRSGKKPLPWWLAPVVAVPMSGIVLGLASAETGSLAMERAGGILSWPGFLLLLALESELLLARWVGPIVAGLLSVPFAAICCLPLRSWLKDSNAMALYGQVGTSLVWLALGIWISGGIVFFRHFAG